MEEFILIKYFNKDSIRLNIRKYCKTLYNKNYELYTKDRNSRIVSYENHLIYNIGITEKIDYKNIGFDTVKNLVSSYVIIKFDKDIEIFTDPFNSILIYKYEHKDYIIITNKISNYKELLNLDLTLNKVNLSNRINDAGEARDPSRKMRLDKYCQNHGLTSTHDEF